MMPSAVDRLAEDKMARTRALELDSFIVEAPAGAGKTELLTQRTLRLLAVVPHPEEVLALTFTNKAATEMRDRILGSLERAASGIVPDEPHKRLTFDLARAVLAHDAAQGWQLLQHPGRLRITTLDALCASLARQMPYLSRFGGQPGVAEDAEAHYRTAARRTLEMVEHDGAEGEVVAAALAFVANDAGRLERLIVAMLNRRDQWIAHAGRVHREDEAELKAEIDAGFAALIGADLGAAVAALDAGWQQRLMPLARFAAANVPELLAPLADWEAPLDDDPADLPAWRALAGLLLTGTGSLRKSLDKRIGFPADAAAKPHKQAMAELLVELAGKAGLVEALAALAELPAPGLSAGEWATVRTFSRLLHLAAGQLWLVFQEAGEVDFSEIAGRATLALGDDEAPTDLAQALDYRIRHLLVDEFQDTSPGQVELIARLIRGWTPDEGRTLFVVGDPMQSIYRFRKADVGLFLDVRARGIGGLTLQHLRLFRNNRSHPAVVDWVNAAFPAIFPAADQPALGAVRYAESAATRAAHPDSGVEIHPILADAAEDGAAEEARRARALIEAARRDDPAGRIAILVRARSHLDALVAELRREAPGLRFQAVEIEGLAGRQHVQDLLTLFRALGHRGDRVHWLALLRAPWCGLTLADLHALAAGDTRRTVWELMHDEERLAALSADGRQRLMAVRAVLALAFAERDRQHPRRALEAVWLMLGGPHCLETPGALADVAVCFERMDQLAASGRLTAETLAEALEELYVPPDPTGEAVQMMTIHKSKGLEFETVIVPGLHRVTGVNETAMLLWDEVTLPDGREALLVAPMRGQGEASGEQGAARDGGRGGEAKGGEAKGVEAKGVEAKGVEAKGVEAKGVEAKGGGAGPTLHDYLRRLEAARGAHEDERLLYVAATRAIRRLHLLGVARRDAGKPDGVRPPPAGSLLARLWPGAAASVFARAAQAETPPATADESDPPPFVPPLLRRAEAGIPEALRRLPPDPRPAAPNPQDADAADSVLSLEASVGTLVHRCLELIAGQGVADWDAARIAGQQPAYARWLAARGHDAEAAARGAGEVVAAVQATLASTQGRWLLAPHPEAAAEQAWSSREGELAVNHVIDRIFIADGCRWIVDYKTVRAPHEELPARAEAFRPQLERYASLFADDPLPLRRAIFFTLQGAWVELV